MQLDQRIIREDKEYDNDLIGSGDYNLIEIKVNFTREGQITSIDRRRDMQCGECWNLFFNALFALLSHNSFFIYTLIMRMMGGWYANLMELKFSMYKRRRDVKKRWWMMDDVLDGWRWINDDEWLMEESMMMTTMNDDESMMVMMNNVMVIDGWE